eukprot:15446078-Alexandrium_andersonii.AAC.1
MSGLSPRERSRREANGRGPEPAPPRLWDGEAGHASEACGAAAAAASLCHRWTIHASAVAVSAAFG